MRCTTCRPRVRETALGDAVHGASHLIVEEMSQTRHAKARGIKHVQIFDLAFEIMQTLDRQHAADHGLSLVPIGQKAIDIGRRPDQSQLTLRVLGKATQFLGMKQRTLQQRCPCRLRLLLKLDQARNGVGIGAVGVVVLSLRRFRHRRKHLERVMALDQARQIDMPAIRSREQIALPQQAVGMHVGHIQRPLQRLRCRRDVERNRHDLVLAALDVSRRERENRGHADDHTDRDGGRSCQNPLCHGNLSDDAIAEANTRVSQHISTSAGYGH